MSAALTPMDAAMNLLARRGYSARELNDRLRRAGMAPELADATVKECIRLGLVNDEAYARDCAEMLAARGLGGRRIRQELVRRGVRDFAGAAAGAQQETEPERAVAAAEYKLRLIPAADPLPKKRQKLWRFLAARGFSGDAIRSAVEKVLNSTDEEVFPD